MAAIAQPTGSATVNRRHARLLLQKTHIKKYKKRDVVQKKHNKNNTCTNENYYYTRVYG